MTTTIYGRAKYSIVQTGKSTWQVAKSYTAENQLDVWEIQPAKFARKVDAVIAAEASMPKGSIRSNERII